MLISTLVDRTLNTDMERVWQYMLISTLVDYDVKGDLVLSDSIC